MAVTVRRKDLFQFADCAAGDAAGDMVRISADKVSGSYQVAKIDLTSIHLPIGMIITKVTSTRCIVQTGGEIIGLYTGLIPGKQLFINTSSRLTHDVPSHPVSGVKLVHPAAQAVSSESLFLRIQTPIIIRA